MRLSLDCSTVGIIGIWNHVISNQTHDLFVRNPRLPLWKMGLIRNNLRDLICICHDSWLFIQFDLDVIRFVFVAIIKILISTPSSDWGRGWGLVLCFLRQDEGDLHPSLLVTLPRPSPGCTGACPHCSCTLACHCANSRSGCSHRSTATELWCGRSARTACSHRCPLKTHLDALILHFAKRWIILSLKFFKIKIKEKCSPFSFHLRIVICTIGYLKNIAFMLI